jgi:hypothetical protein
MKIALLYWRWADTEKTETDWTRGPWVFNCTGQSGPQDSSSLHAQRLVIESLYDRRHPDIAY